MMLAHLATNEELAFISNNQQQQSDLETREQSKQQHVQGVMMAAGYTSTAGDTVEAVSSNNSRPFKCEEEEEEVEMKPEVPSDQQQPHSDQVDQLAACGAGLSEKEQREANDQKIEQAKRRSNDSVDDNNDDNDDDQERAIKRPASSKPMERNVEVRLLVRRREAGALIGKRGANIKRMREQFSEATFNIPDTGNGPERVACIATNSLDSLDAILADVTQLFQEKQHQQKQQQHQYNYQGQQHHQQSSSNQSEQLARRLSSSTSVSNSNSTSSSTTATDSASASNSGNELEQQIEMKLLINSSHAGLLIGIGGQSIRKLRNDSRAAIKIYEMCCPLSSERVCAIKAKPAVVVGTIRMILAILADNPIKGVHKTYDALNYDLGLVDKYGGYTNEEEQPRAGLQPNGLTPPPPSHLFDLLQFGAHSGGFVEASSSSPHHQHPAFIPHPAAIATPFCSGSNANEMNSHFLASAAAAAAAGAPILLDATGAAHHHLGRCPSFFAHSPYHPLSAARYAPLAQVATMPLSRHGSLAPYQAEQLCDRFNSARQVAAARTNNYHQLAASSRYHPYHHPFKNHAPNETEPHYRSISATRYRQSNQSAADQCHYWRNQRRPGDVSKRHAPAPLQPGTVLASAVNMRRDQDQTVAAHREQKSGSTGPVHFVDYRPNSAASQSGAEEHRCSSLDTHRHQSPTKPRSCCPLPEASMGQLQQANSHQCKQQHHQRQQQQVRDTNSTQVTKSSESSQRESDSGAVGRAPVDG